jgi:hypothetical protein
VLLSRDGALFSRDPPWHLRLALIYGVALALTLDEFALWLRLADVYWSPEGRESVEVVAVAASVLALMAVGEPFWRAAVGEIWHGSGHAPSTSKPSPPPRERR